MRVKTLVIALLCVFALVAAACGGRDDETSEPAEETPATTAAPAATDAPEATTDDSGGETAATTAAPEADPCEAEPPADTDIGVSADTLTVVVMADVETPLAPGLFRGSVDGVNAWADHVNGEGGLACRQIEVIFHDALLSPNDTTNGFLTACEQAIALVGTTVLFGLNTDDLNSCPDAEGNPIGVADISYITTEPPHQCSPNSFHLSRPGASCPWAPGDGSRDYLSQVGPIEWLLENVNADLTGVYLVPADLPSTTASAFPQIEAQNQVQANLLAEAYGVSGSQTQAEYGEVVQAIRDGGLNYLYNGSNDQALLKARAEFAAQGIDESTVTWVCSSSCYTPSFLEGGDNAEGTYVWMNFLPFEEADTNEELGDFMASIDDPFPQAWAAGSWANGVLFEQAINAIVERDGVNGITRQSLLDELRTVQSFSSGDWWGEVDMSTTLAMGKCWMMLQVQGGEYVRVFPEERGTLTCSEPVATSGDASAFAPS